MDKAEREAAAEKKPTTKLIIVASTTCTIRKLEATNPKMPDAANKITLFDFLFMYFI